MKTKQNGKQNWLKEVAWRWPGLASCLNLMKNILGDLCVMAVLCAPWRLNLGGLLYENID
jgi:hypothetical protein